MVLLELLQSLGSKVHTCATCTVVREQQRLVVGLSGLLQMADD